MKIILMTFACMLAAKPALALMEPATPESQGVSSEAILKFVEAAEKAFVAGTSRSHSGLWFKGCSVEIDPESYEGLGAYVGKHKIATACWHDADGAFHLKAYFTGDTGWLELTDKGGKLTGEFWAMGGCKLESK